MVQFIINLKKDLLDLLSNHDLNYAENIDCNNFCVFELLQQNKHIIDNDFIIETLMKKYQRQSVNNRTENITILYHDKINEYFTQGYFIFKDSKNIAHYAVSDILYLKKIEQLHATIVTHNQRDNLDPEYNNLSPEYLDRLSDKSNVYLVSHSDLYQMLEKHFTDYNMQNAISYPHASSSQPSAKNINYAKNLLLCLLLFATSLICFAELFCIINNVLYFIQNAIKIIIFQKAAIETNPLLSQDKLYHVTSTQNTQELYSLLLSAKDSTLPTYSILIPLYKETQTVESILRSIESIEYPTDKLDVKLIIEEDDTLIIQKLKSLNLASYIHIIRVPYHLPRTKPKALNYAMHYVRGEFVAIYDAEDIPDPNQLLKALYLFDKLPENYACIQSKLNFYNSEENLVTKFFSIEYSMWFDYLLKGLSAFDLPITLGGTSNHFKTKILKKVGYWDPYNVTEDADLGIRLYINAYKVYLMDSITLEEAPISVYIWLAQRSRWIKGFLQTIFVFFKTKKDYKKLSVIQISSVYIFVGFTTYSFLLTPWLFALLVLHLIQYNNYLTILSMLNIIFFFFCMYIVSWMISKKTKKSIIYFAYLDWLAIIAWPLYFMLHTIASYRALWELIREPFQWNKTTHGISRVNSSHNINSEFKIFK